MFKKFKDYLTESQKTFSFKLWFANADFVTNANDMDRLECALQKYKLLNISKLKTQPTKEHEFFPGFGAVELSTVEIDLAYPCNATQVYDAVVRSGINIPNRNVAVFSKDQNETSPDYSQYPPKEALLNSEYEANNDAGKSYGEKSTTAFLKSLSTGKSTAKTTNDDAMGTVSPIGSKKTIKPPLAKIGSQK